MALYKVIEVPKYVFFIEEITFVYALHVNDTFFISLLRAFFINAADLLL